MGRRFRSFLGDLVTGSLAARPSDGGARHPSEEKGYGFCGVPSTSAQGSPPNNWLSVGSTVELPCQFCGL